MTNVSNGPGGRVFGIKSSDEPKSEPWTLTPAGTLEILAPFGGLSDSMDSPGEVDTAKGKISFPPVEQLRELAKTNGSFEIDMQSSQYRSSTTDGSDTLRVDVSLTISGRSRAAITTPAGTFRNVVGTAITITGMKPTNAKPNDPIGKVLTATGKSLKVTSTLWWARGVGLVDLQYAGPSPTETKLEHCG